MAGRKTNLALLILLVSAGVTGLLAFGLGTEVGRVAVVAHGIAGIGLIVLAPWKGAIVRRGLRRGRKGRHWSIVLVISVAIALISGFVQSSGVASSVGPLTTMQVHVGSAVIALVLGAAHVVIRPTRPRRADLNRRAFLRAGGLAAVSAGGLLLVEGAMRLLRLPGANRRFTGSHERGSFQPVAMPTTQWFNDRTQHVDRSAYALTVNNQTYPLEELGAFDDRLIATLDCTSGWYSTQEWAGIRLDRLIEEYDGDSVLVRSVTGYSRRFPLADAAHLILATRVGGNPLSAGHGAPVRLVAPGRRGFWWVKWVAEVRVDDRPPWWQSPFPLT